MSKRDVSPPPTIPVRCSLSRSFRAEIALTTEIKMNNYGALASIGCASTKFLDRCFWVIMNSSSGIPGAALRLA
ncbi:MAG: hypothetical protein M0008_02125 [Actinomycetota bacterium]|nr:hypothetical protein [Actinomycetota bacterium]